MRDPVKLLLNRATKDKALQTLLDSPLTHSDIEKLDQPKWVKQALFKLANHKVDLEFEAFVLANAKDSFNEDFTGTIKQWTLPGETFVMFGKTELLITEGDLLFVTDTGVWAGSSYCTNLEKNVLDNNSIEVRVCKFTEYKLSVKDRLNSKYSFPEDINEKPRFTIRSWTGEYPA